MNAATVTMTRLGEYCITSVPNSAFKKFIEGTELTESGNMQHIE